MIKLNALMIRTGLAAAALLIATAAYPDGIINSGGSGSTNLSGDVTSVGGVTSYNNAVPVAKGGTGQATAAAARGSSGLNIEGITRRTDSDYTVLNTDRVVALVSALTATRTWTLPALSTMNPGQQIVFTDVASALGGANAVTISRAASDTFAGGTTTYSFNTSKGSVVVVADPADGIWAVYKAGQ